MLGSDIGGYLDRDDVELTQLVPFDQDNFARWTALGALMPFMQLHGRANLTPWTVSVRPEETERIYRYWATLHHELVPFFYSLSEERYAHGARVPLPLRPVGTEREWPGDYRYLLGEALLVAPVLNASGRRDVTLPAGSRWYDFWDLSGGPMEGGRTLRAVDTTDRARIPVYVREGAIVPMKVSNALTGFGTQSSEGALTVAVWPSSTATRFTLHDEDSRSTLVSVQGTSTGATITLSRLRVTTVLRVRHDAPDPRVMAEEGLSALRSQSDFDTTSEGFWYDAPRHTLWIKLRAADSPRSVTVLQVPAGS